MEDKSILLNTLLTRQINEFNIKRIINFDSREIPTTMETELLQRI